MNKLNSSYKQRSLTFEETKKYYENLIGECQNKIRIIDSQIKLLQDKPEHNRVRESYLAAKEKNQKMIGACRIYIFGLKKQAVPLTPEKTKSTNEKKSSSKKEKGTKFRSVIRTPFNQHSPIKKKPASQYFRSNQPSICVTGEIYVNRKQYNRIIKRREAREKLEKMLHHYRLKNPKYNPKLKSIASRKRGDKGQFIPSDGEYVPKSKLSPPRRSTRIEEKKKRKLEKHQEVKPAKESGIKKSQKTTPKQVISID